VTPATGDIRLFAKDATVHGATARYEPLPYKNTIGFWTKPEDWVSWDQLGMLQQLGIVPSPR